MIRLFIRFYQVCISPVLHLLAGPGGGCRFEPTCSQYFLEAVEEHGNLKGSWLGIKRICRCNPWGGHGLDPVPKAEKTAVSSTPHCCGHGKTH